jgi:hypothetical protein
MQYSTFSLLATDTLNTLKCYKKRQQDVEAHTVQRQRGSHILTDSRFRDGGEVSLMLR